jgi:myo-inositol-1(or 4)-monophosphatase
LAYVASGRFDTFWGTNLSPWDVAAGKLLVEEAGGKVSFSDGSPYDMFNQHTIVASNGHLHQSILELLK